MRTEAKFKVMLPMALKREEGHDLRNAGSLYGAAKDREMDSPQGPQSSVALPAHGFDPARPQPDFWPSEL